ncbi:MAG: hypothetical protein HS111_16850 [Kofleriaceae bacterium]|nr:hypothetical protein [Kofleriaceae bacterium]
MPRASTKLEKKNLTEERRLVALRRHVRPSRRGGAASVATGAWNAGLAPRRRNTDGLLARATQGLKNHPPGRRRRPAPSVGQTASAPPARARPAARRVGRFTARSTAPAPRAGAPPPELERR